MPFNFEALRRRRALLGLTQQDLGIIAGVSPSTVQRIERELVPEEGGLTGIDVVMRIAEALRMEPGDLMIPPKGNKYERAVQFAITHRDPNPKYIDRSRTVRADGFRRLTRLAAASDMAPIIDREEPDDTGLDEAIPLPEPADVPVEEAEETALSFLRDPSTE